MDSAMYAIKRLLLVEDDPKDLRFAVEVAQQLGITDVEARTSPDGARSYLDKGLQGECALPDGIILDLDLGYESGYELLRLWHSTPRLHSIPLIVWSVLGDEQRDICSLFNVTSFVGKWEGEAALREALRGLQPTAG